MKPSSWTKDADVIENEVIMGRQMHRGSFLILEGEDDHRFWDRRVLQECELVVGDGKPNVEGAIIRLDTRRFSGALVPHFALFFALSEARSGQLQNARAQE